MALDEARRHLGHHQLTDLLRQLTSYDPDRSGVVPTTVAVKALAAALGQYLEDLNSSIICIKVILCFTLVTSQLDYILRVFTVNTSFVFSLNRPQ